MTGAILLKLTIRKIAELAGVSRGTVDKVIHNRPGVSRDVRARIQAILDSYEYTPHAYTRNQLPAQRNYVVAAILPPISNPFFANIKRGMEQMQTQLPKGRINVEYFFCDSANIPELISILDYLEEHNVDGLLLRGAQSQELCARLNALSIKDIPVVLFDADLHGAKRLCMVGEDSRISGRVAASLLAKSIGGAGEVAIISGLPDITTHQSRLQGFQEVIRESFPKIHIVETIYSNDQSVIAYQKTSALVRKHPNLRGIFSVVGCTGDIGQALMDSKKHHVKMVSYNFTPDIIALVKRGMIDFTIGLSPYQQGETALRILSEFLLERKRPENDFIEMPILIGVDENVELLLKNQLI